MRNFIICFHHTQWEVFLQIKFHPGMKFYSFHPGMKFTCKQKFFHPRTSFIQDEISSWLHVNALLIVCLVSLKYREIIRIKTLILYKKTFFFIKSLENKKKKLALTSIYYVSQEIWLGNSKKLICIDQSRFYIFSHPRESKNV